MYEYYGNSGVSVVIPTLNAGNGFEKLMLSLRHQKNVEAIQIIVVDSGSTDETLEIARQYNADVISIPHDKFTHSYARNLGAEHAIYDYLAFMTQDALPENEFWLSNMRKPLWEDEIAASTCIEKPRTDADLFARTAIHFQMLWLDVKNKNRIMKKYNPENTKESYEVMLRRNACLNDVACMYKKEIFMKYKYRLKYAEDLDMGIRLIEDGYKLALLGNVKVIHSHNREGFYYLKRMIVEQETFAELFGTGTNNNINEDGVIAGIVWLYDKIENWVSEIYQIPLLYSKEAVLEKIQDICQLSGGIGPRVGRKEIEDKSFEKFIAELRKKCSELPESILSQEIKRKFFMIFSEKMKTQIDFLWNSKDELTFSMLYELCCCMYCDFGSTVGTILGDLYVEKDDLYFLSNFRAELKQGI